MKNVLKKGIAFTLALTLSVSSANVSLFITKANQQAEEKSNVENSNFTVNSETVKPKVVEEVMSDRTTDSTTFLLSNGMKQTTYYSDDIYFENEKGKLAEYDNEFVKLDKNDKKQVVNSVEVSGSEKEEYSYVNNEGDPKQFLPNKLSEKTPVVMTKENYVVSFAPTDVKGEGEEGRLVKSEKNNKLTYKTVRCTYKYDKVGNRTYELEFETDTVATDQSKTTGYYSYNGYNELNQLTSSTVIECADGSNVKSYSKSYNYDNKGNQISVIDSGKKTNTTYKYDVNSQLIDVEIKTNGVITSKQHNEYNGQGQRILKTDTQIEGNKVNYQTINYYYEGSLLLYTTDEKGNKTSQNIIGNDSNAFATIRYDSGTQTEYFYSKDVQGSVVAILNNSGKCEQAYSYTDYGETQKNIDSKFYNEICYTGGIYDENTGLYYLNARYYDSSDGEFLSQDTYRGTETDKDTWNLYAYCSGNPINYVDPSGHKKNRNSGQYYPAGAWDSIREQEAKKYTYYNTNKARKYIYKYLRKKLKTNKKQACAILGNIYVETWHTYSSLILQGSSEPAFWYVKKYDAYDSKGWGILQWTYFTRKEALLKYVKKANNKHRTQSLNVGDLIVQLEYFNKERKSAYKNKWKIFKGKKEIADMVNSFCKDYEQAGVPHLDERINTAKKLLKKYK